MAFCDVLNDYLFPERKFVSQLGSILSPLTVQLLVDLRKNQQTIQIQQCVLSCRTKNGHPN